MNSTELKLKLQDLISNSVALKSLPEEAQKIRTQAMLNSDDDTMMQFIAVLENESKQIKVIDDNATKETEKITQLLDEAKTLEKEAEREVRKEEENLEHTKEESEAEALLKKLDDIE
ncbi:hypothetical protein J7J83_03645 [bacterium]|nr:hypothetical protein [bacterium]